MVYDKHEYYFNRKDQIMK